jgi:hypothetical protein
MKRLLSFLPAVFAGLLAGWLISKFIVSRTGARNGSDQSAAGKSGVSIGMPARTSGPEAWAKMMEARALLPIPVDDGHFIDGTFTIGSIRADGSLDRLSPARRDLEIELSRSGLSETGINDTVLGFPFRGGDPGFAEASARLAKTNPVRALAQVERLSGRTDRLSPDTIDRARRLVFREWLRKDPQAALAAATSSHEVKSSIQRSHRLTLVMDEWSKLDPAAAAAALPGLPQVGADFERKRIAEDILHNWHGQDPAAARAWASGTTDPALRESLLSLTEELKATTPAAKTAVLLANPGAEGHKLAWSFAEWLAAEPAVAVEKLSSIPANDRFWQNNAADVAEWWAISARGDITAEQFLDSIKSVPPGAQRETILKGLAQYGASNDIPFGVRMVSEMTEGRPREDAVGSLTELWMRRDPVKTSEWLTSLPADSESRHAGVARFADGLAPDDPERAAQWAASIPDSYWQKESVMKSVLDKWRAKDPVAVEAWLQKR